MAYTVNYAKNFQNQLWCMKPCNKWVNYLETPFIGFLPSTFFLQFSVFVGPKFLEEIEPDSLEEETRQITGHGWNRITPVK